MWSMLPRAAGRLGEGAATAARPSASAPAPLILAILVLGFAVSAPASGAGVENRVGDLNREAHRAFLRKDFRRVLELVDAALAERGEEQVLFDWRARSR